MEQLVIDKLNLKLTPWHIGESFVKNCHIYLWPNGVKGCKTYVLDCDTKGQPLTDEILFLVRKRATSECIYFFIPIGITHDDESFEIMLDYVRGSGQPPGTY